MTQSRLCRCHETLIVFLAFDFENQLVTAVVVNYYEFSNWNKWRQ